MLKNERRGSEDRRKADSINSQSPFLIGDGLVFTDRRKSVDRRNSIIEEMVASGDVEEIELKPVPYL